MYHCVILCPGTTRAEIANQNILLPDSPWLVVSMDKQKNDSLFLGIFRCQEQYGDCGGYPISH